MLEFLIISFVLAKVVYDPAADRWALAKGKEAPSVARARAALEATEARAAARAARPEPGPLGKFVRGLWEDKWDDAAWQMEQKRNKKRKQRELDAAHDEAERIADAYGDETPGSADTAVDPDPEPTVELVQCQRCPTEVRRDEAEYVITVEDGLVLLCPSCHAEHLARRQEEKSASGERPAEADTAPDAVPAPGTAPDTVEDTAPHWPCTQCRNRTPLGELRDMNGTMLCRDCAKFVDSHAATDHAPQDEATPQGEAEPAKAVCSSCRLLHLIENLVDGECRGCINVRAAYERIAREQEAPAQEAPAQETGEQEAPAQEAPAPTDDRKDVEESGPALDAPAAPDTEVGDKPADDTIPVLEGTVIPPYQGGPHLTEGNSTMTVRQHDFEVYTLEGAIRLTKDVSEDGRDLADKVEATIPVCAEITDVRTLAKQLELAIRTCAAGGVTGAALEHMNMAAEEFEGASALMAEVMASLNTAHERLLNGATAMARANAEFRADRAVTDAYAARRGAAKRNFVTDGAAS